MQQYVIRYVPSAFCGANGKRVYDIDKARRFDTYEEAKAHTQGLRTIWQIEAIEQQQQEEAS